MVVKAGKGDLKAILSIAATFIGTVVGAGFASGQEIYQFFSRFGLMGFPGLFLAILLLGWAANQVYEMGLRLQTYSYRDLLIELVGRRLTVFADLFLLVFFLLLTGVMFAGSGAVFQEFHLGYGWGVILTMVVLMVVLARGLTGLIEINLLVIPLMFIACFGVTCYALINRNLREIPTATDANWLMAAVQFASYNLILALPVLLALAKDYPDRKILRFGSRLGSICLGLLAFLIHAAILVHYDSTRNSALPMVVLAKKMSLGFSWGYGLVLWGEMLTTLLANVYGLAKRLAAWSGGAYGKWVVVFGGAGIVIAQMGFVKLIAVFYPIYGYLSMILLFLIIVKPLK